jgi:hypothetical protein
LTANQVTAAPSTIPAASQPDEPDGANGRSPGRESTRSAAAKATAYWPALNAARHGRWRIRTADAATATVCTATAGPSPHVSRIAKVKQIDGKTGDSWRGPGGVNGRTSETTASAAMSQKAVPDGRVAAVSPVRCGATSATPSRHTAAT